VRLRRVFVKLAKSRFETMRMSAMRRPREDQSQIKGLLQSSILCQLRRMAGGAFFRVRVTLT
jgi:hypothetical protein